MESIPGLLAVLVLVAANGFFVAAEFSLVSVRRTQIDQMIAQGNRGARAIRRGINRLDAMLSACQLGITLASLALGWIGEPALAHLIEPLFAQFLPADVTFWSSHAVAVALAFTIITTLHIVLGELAPKSLAIQRPLGTALWVSRPLNWFYVIFRPAIWTLNGLGNGVLRIFGLHGAAGHQLIYSPEELVMLVESSQQGGQIESQEAEIVSRALEMDEIRLDSVMVPRARVKAVEQDATVPEILAALRSEAHTRVPVYDGTIDDLVGVIHIKDIALHEGPADDLRARDLARPILLLPYSLLVGPAIQRMRKEGSYLAAVIDEHGGTAGIVTMEDLIEEVVGDIRDEFDVQEQPGLSRQPDGTWLIDGTLPIHDVNRALDIHLVADPADRVTTIGGWIMAKLGRLPQPGDQVDSASAQWEVIDVVDRHVGKVRARLTPKSQAADEEE